ncbi:MAG: hypothetical protein H8E05_00235 [Bacteroidetes bacterium]|nr:hypothetical protein [Bacteroidota bacterium]
MKMIMKEQTNKANNLILGAIYINANTGQPCRLVNIVSCQGVWLETFDGQGYGDLVKFEDCHYADIDEVTDYLEDYCVYNSKPKAPAYKPEREYAYGKEIVRDYDGSAVIGWYDDNDGYDIRCRD